MRNTVLALGLVFSSTACMHLESRPQPAARERPAKASPRSPRVGAQPFELAATHRVEEATTTDLVLQGAAGVALAVSVFLYVK